MEVTGAGDPLVLLHGLGNSSLFWEPTVDRIQGRRVIAVDLPGYGTSLPPRRWTIEELVSPVRDLLDHLDAFPCVMVGHSFGGLLAIQQALTDPTTVSRLVLVDAHMFSVMDLLTGKRRLSTSPSLVLNVAAQVIGGVLPMTGSLPRLVTSSRLARRFLLWPFLADPVGIEPATIRRALSGNLGGTGVLSGIRSARAFDVEAAVSRIRCPVDLLWGSKDRLLRPQDHIQAGLSLPTRRMEEVFNAGHWSQLECPATVAAFLTIV